MLILTTCPEDNFTLEPEGVDIPPVDLAQHPPQLRKWDIQSVNWIRKKHCQRGGFFFLIWLVVKVRPSLRLRLILTVVLIFDKPDVSLHRLVPVLFLRGISHAEGVQLSTLVEWGLSSPLRTGGRYASVCVGGGLLKNKLCLWSQRVPEQWKGRGGGCRGEG